MKKYLKTLLSLALIVVLAISVAGCKDNYNGTYKLTLDADPIGAFFYGMDMDEAFEKSSIKFLTPTNGTGDCEMYYDSQLDEAYTYTIDGNDIQLDLGEFASYELTITGTKTEEELSLTWTIHIDENGMTGDVKLYFEYEYNAATEAYDFASFEIEPIEAVITIELKDDGVAKISQSLFGVNNTVTVNYKIKDGVMTIKYEGETMLQGVIDKNKIEVDTRTAENEGFGDMLQYLGIDQAVVTFRK